MAAIAHQDDDVPTRTWAGGRGLVVALSTLGRGLAAGIVLGVAFRAWMRLVSTRPEFSWSGTIFIVLSVTVLTVLVSVTATARERWRSRPARGAMRVVGGLAIYGVLQGPGGLAAPSVILGGLALGRTSWSRPVRVVLGGLAGAGLLILPLVESATFEQLGPLRAAAGLVSYAALVVTFARLFAVPTSSAGSRWSRWPSFHLQPRRDTRRRDLGSGPA